MGGGRGGGYGSHASAGRLRDALDRLTRRFPTATSGYFGQPSPTGDARIVVSTNPTDSSRTFFNLASSGADRVTVSPGGGTAIAQYGKDSFVTWRITSHSDGSPAVDFNLSIQHLGIRPVQRIHFMMEAYT